MPNSAALRARVATRMLRDPRRECIPGPPIRTLSQWARDLATRADMLGGCAFPAIADHWTLVTLWEDAIADGSGYIAPAERAALADRAVEADRLLRQWLDDEPDVRGSPAWRQLLSWRSRVDARLVDSGRQPAADQFRALAGRLRTGEVPARCLPRRVSLSGFAELTRAERSLIEALRQAGTEVTEEDAAPAAPGRLLSYDDPEAEVAAAADWAADQVEAGRRRVAVIVNGPDALTGRLAEALANRLHPRRCLRLDSLQQADFHPVRGRPLTAVPLVRDALLLLDLSLAGVREPQEFHLISSFLLSPAWAGAAVERAARAGLEVELRRMGGYRWSLARVAEHAAHAIERRPLPVLADRINGLPRLQRRATPARQFRDWLEHWGWPGEAVPDETVRASVTQIQQALEQLSCLPSGSPRRCLSLLRRMLAGARIDDIGGPLSPVQVLSPEDACGQRFEAAWMLNATAEDWPGSPHVNPFIPHGLRGSIPRATDEGMYAYGRRLTRAVQGCAGEVVFSFARFRGDTPQAPSYLLRHLSPREGEGVADGALWRQCVPVADRIGTGEHPWLRAISDHEGRALDTQKVERVPRFVRALELQSACPLSAYLAHRLNAAFPDAPQPFPAASLTGMIVHRALEALYRPMLEGDARPRAAGVAGAVDEALTDARADFAMLPAVLAVERERIEALLRDWLEFERARWPHRPHRLEWRTNREFAGLEVEVRVDRVDRSEDGKEFIIDYKTGSSVSVSGWADERPGQLQLPLYAVLLSAGEGTRPQGVAMAHVRRDAMKYVGATGDRACRVNGISAFTGSRTRLDKAFDSWDACLGHWERSLNELAAEYKAGICVNRMHDEGALTFSGLDILLRAREGLEWLEERGFDASE